MKEAFLCELDEKIVQLWCEASRDLWRSFTWDTIAERVNQQFGLKLSAESCRAKLRRFRRVFPDRFKELSESPWVQPIPAADPPDDAEITDIRVVERIWGSLLQVQDNLAEIDTVKPVVEIAVETDRPWGKVFFSDQHVLGVGVNHRRLEHDLKVWDQHRDIMGVADLGDNLDQFLPTKHPSAMMETLARPGVQRSMVRHLWKKYLGDGLLKVKVRGNHDAWSAAADYDFAADLASEMRVPFLGDGGRVWLKVGGELYKLELRHDFPFKSSLNTTNSQRRLFEFALGADVVVFGHLHYPDMGFPWRHGQDVAMLRCSTYKERDPWAQAKGLQLGYAIPPPDMPMVIFWPDRHKILPFRNYEDGLVHLKALLGRRG